MKTQIEKFENSQAFNNKVMLISLMVFACILIIMPIKGKWYSHSNSLLAVTDELQMHNNQNTQIALFTEEENKGRESTSSTYMIPLEANLETNAKSTLETTKLDDRISENVRYLSNSLLYTLADVEEPEFLITDVLPMINKQTENYNHVYTLMEQEEDPALDIENWMTDQSFWKNPAQKNEFERFSAEMYASNNSETDEMAELIRKTKSYAELEVEEPLEVEHWMVCENFWCTDKKTSNFYKESFALYEEK